MRCLMKLSQAKDEIPEELGTRATKLSALTFLEEAKENVAIRVHLADLYVDALINERIRHGVIKETLVRLSVAIEDEK